MTFLCRNLFDDGIAVGFRLSGRLLRFGRRMGPRWQARQLRLEWACGYKPFAATCAFSATGERKELSISVAFLRSAQVVGLNEEVSWSAA